MSIDGITGTTPSPATTTGSTQLQGTKDEFLRLFMAQLQHQDPFAPTSGADMVAQLAQLSSVEQAKQTNAMLADLATAQNAVANANLASLVGRDCSATASGFSIGAGDASGTPPPLDISTTSPTKGASVVIKDASGKEVRRIPIPDGSMSTSIAWDGKNATGGALPAGDYQISVEPGGTASTINASWHGRVDAVELTANGPRLRMGGLLLLPGDIHTIGNQAAVTASKATP
jgi:flagellar basal-body rod modification protein FlgD